MPPGLGWRGLIYRLRRDPLGAMSRAVQKLVLGPLRYGRGGDYDAGRYWRDRLGGGGGTLHGAGHQGMSEEENARSYAEAVATFRRVCAEQDIVLSRARVLDVGCGSGVFTRACREDGVPEYTGVDLTDVLFGRLAAEYPGYRFHRADITTDALPGRYDLVLALDLLEHVVDRTRLRAALANLSAAVSAQGLLLLALPLASGSPRPFFYLRWWSLEEIREGLTGFRVGDPVPWRDGSLLVVRRGGDPGAG